MNERKYFADSFLNEQEQTQLAHFADNEKMVEAVRKVMVAGLYENGVVHEGRRPEPRQNAAFYLVSSNPDATNEQLGADNRARWEAANIVDRAFQIIEEYKTPEEQRDKGTIKSI